MDDIDDYFNDDLVLDEQTLALLDREEQKYFSQIQRQPAVTKKLKTRDGWSPGVGSRMREDDFEDLPEISVTVDGNYDFTDSTSTSAPFNTSQPKRLNVPESQLRPQSTTALSHYKPAPLRSTLHFFRPRCLPISNPAPLRQQSVDYTPPIPSQPTRPPGLSGLESQLAELRTQLLDLKNENQKFQNALKDATEVRYAKEGEVSILRKSIEKTAQIHAAEIAKMKAAREEADAKQKQMERQMKEETERLKTQFIFKQHELEASLRKPPASVRATRVMKSIPATPGRVPSQITAWATNNQGGEASQRLTDTPRNLRQNSGKTRNDQKSPEVIKRSTILPGFQNSFMATPLKPSPKAATRGEQIGSQTVARPSVTPTHYRTVDSLDFGDNLNTILNSDDLPPVDEDGDAIMLNELSERVALEVEPIEPLNHKAELSRIILTHMHLHTNETTFQLLIGLPFSQNLSSVRAKQCTQACQAILVALSNPVDDSDYPTCVYQVTKYLLLILQYLLIADPCFPLIALLNLLRSLVSALPSLSKVLLAHNGEDNEDASLLATICDSAEHLVTFSSDVAEGCLAETLSLLESLLYDIPDETVPRLALTPKQMNSLVALLSISRPHGLMEVLSRVFMLLATYGSIHPQLSAPVERDNRQEGQGFKDSPLIHGLCVYLLESLDDDFNESTITSSNLIGCLAQISLTQAEPLVESLIVIPTLVYFVARLVTRLWTSDESHLSGSQARSMIRSIDQGLLLLHNLVHLSEPSIRLHEKLQRPPHRSLNNLVHMFVVSFGQLSYSDPPDWIDREGKMELENFVEPARELLDLVVDGPEGDSIWAAYQMEPENESETDEEEREARLMDAGV